MNSNSVFLVLTIFCKSMLHMTKAGMEAWQIPVPPLSEQKRIATILDAAEALREQRRQAVAKTDLLINSLQQRAFTGEL